MICNNNCDRNMIDSNNSFGLCCNVPNGNILWLKLTMSLSKRKLFNSVYFQNNNNLFFINNSQNQNINTDNNINENEKKSNELENEEYFYIYINLNSVSQIKNVKGDSLYVKITNENNYMVFYYEDIKNIEIIDMKSFINELKI